MTKPFKKKQKSTILIYFLATSIVAKIKFPIFVTCCVFFFIKSFNYLKKYS